MARPKAVAEKTLDKIIKRKVKNRSLPRIQLLRYLAEHEERDCYAYGMAKALGISLSATYSNLDLFEHQRWAVPHREFGRYPFVPDRPERNLYVITRAGQKQLVE